jgi:hypothetical protein
VTFEFLKIRAVINTPDVSIWVQCINLVLHMSSRCVAVSDGRMGPAVACMSPVILTRFPARQGHGQLVAVS